MGYNLFTQAYDLSGHAAQDLVDLLELIAEKCCVPTLSGTAIAGTRTDDETFTRTSGTWTADALIGQYVWSHKSGEPEDGVLLEITDNGTDTVTVDGVLHATGTAIMVFETEQDALDAMTLVLQTSA